jgi:hypothetical protein
VARARGARNPASNSLCAANHDMRRNTSALHCPKTFARARRHDPRTGNDPRDATLPATFAIAQPMKSRLRYLSALLINVALPWLVYRLVFPHWGQSGALAASALPLIAWMSWDLLHYRHFDALSALVLTGIVLSLVARFIGGSTRLQSIEDPLVSGLIGISFLASLVLHRPWVFYLARSTMSREDHRSAESFERHWHERPTLAAYIRLMTLVWGIGMIGENIVRCAIVWHWPDDSRAVLASTLLRYGVYAALTLWTFWIRRLIKQDARRYGDDDEAVASSPVSP